MHRSVPRSGSVRGALCLAAALCVLAPAVHGAILGIQANASVYSIDETTGVATLLSNNPTFAANAMSRNSAGVYYTAGGLGNGGLSTINPTTGVLTAGPDITPNDDVRGLAFSPSDVLYATIASGGGSSANLYTINVSTGATTLIGAVGIMQGLTFSSSGTLYGWSNVIGLVTIDPTTGVVTDVNPSVGSADNIQTLAFSPGGVLYGGSQAVLYTINTSTGEPTVAAVFSPIDDLRGMEFLTGAPPAPGVSLTPSPVAFGNQVLSTTSAAQVVTLQNIGTATLSITGLSTTGDFAQTNTCGATLAVAASCTISVTFTPTALGARVGNVSVTSNAASSPNLVPLSGTGISAPVGPVASLTPASVGFGTQQTGTTSPVQVLTLQNTGGAILTIAGIAATGDFAQVNTCGPTLAPAASCTINVTFTPTAQGERFGALTVTSDGAGSPNSAVLFGEGAIGPAAAFEPIPTLSEWGLILLSMLVALAALGQRRIRSRR